MNMFIYKSDIKKFVLLVITFIIFSGIGLYGLAYAEMPTMLPTAKCERPPGGWGTTKRVKPLPKELIYPPNMAKPTAQCQSSYGTPTFMGFIRKPIPDECMHIPTRERPDGTMEIIPHDEHMEMLRKKYKQDQIKSFERFNNEAREAKQIYGN